MHRRWHGRGHVPMRDWRRRTTHSSPHPPPPQKREIGRKTTWQASRLSPAERAASGRRLGRTKDAGYRVMADYPGNDEAAHRFKADTGIAVKKWDVSDFEACASHLEDCRGRPIDVLVDNASITRASCSTRCRRAVVPDDQHHPQRPVQRDSAVIKGMRARGSGRIVCISSINGQKGQMGRSTIRPPRRANRLRQGAGPGGAAKSITVNAHLPGLYRRRDGARRAQEVLEKRILPPIPVGRLGEPEESRAV